MAARASLSTRAPSAALLPAQDTEDVYQIPNFDDGQGMPWPTSSSKCAPKTSYNMKCKQIVKMKDHE